jgi:hypothetical protein
MPENSIDVLLAYQAVQILHGNLQTAAQNFLLFCELANSKIRRIEAFISRYQCNLDIGNYTKSRHTHISLHCAD